MKNVGILTHWDIPNYGAFLQAYALQQVLQNMTPDDCNVVQIAYANPVHTKNYYSFELHELFRYWAINRRFYRDVYRRLRNRQDIMMRRKFLEYYDSMIPHSQVFRGKELEDFHFDEVVLGSDILWDYSIRVFGNDKYVFGNDLNADRMTSYAASFGTVKYTTGGGVKLLIMLCTVFAALMLYQSEI